MSILDDFDIFEREHGHPVPPFGESCPADCPIAHPSSGDTVPGGDA